MCCCRLLPAAQLLVHPLVLLLPPQPLLQLHQGPEVGLLILCHLYLLQVQLERQQLQGGLLLLASWTWVSSAALSEVGQEGAGPAPSTALA
jgi:hypothetical protein